MLHCQAYCHHCESCSIVACNVVQVIQVLILFNLLYINLICVTGFLWHGGIFAPKPIHVRPLELRQAHNGNGQKTAMHTRYKYTMCMVIYMSEMQKIAVMKMEKYGEQERVRVCLLVSFSLYDCNSDFH